MKYNILILVLIASLTTADHPFLKEDGVCIDAGSSEQCTASSQCCDNCCLYNYCEEHDSCTKGCIDSSDVFSGCTHDEQCCSGCCHGNTCIDTSNSGCPKDYFENTWFIVIFYVLLPLLALCFIVVLIIYFIKRSRRKNLMDEANRDYLERTAFLAAQVSPRS